MNMSFSKILLLLTLGALSTSALAQSHSKIIKHDKDELKLEDITDGDDDDELKIDSLESAVSSSSKILLTIGYANQVVIQGRNYGLQSYSLSPGLKYEDKSGFSATLGSTLWDSLPEETGRGLRNAETSIGLGYSFKVNKKISAGLGYEHWFTNYGSDTLRKALTNYFNADLDYDLDFIRLGLAAYFITGKQTGIGTDFSIIIPFEFSKIFGMDKLKIEPTIMANLSDGEIARPYLLRAVGKNGKPLIDKKGNPVYVRKTSTDNKFRIMDYDISLPLTYSLLGVVDITPTLHYILPQNVNPGENIINGLDSSTPFFYFTLETQWLLWRKKKSTK